MPDNGQGGLAYDVAIDAGEVTVDTPVQLDRLRSRSGNLKLDGVNSTFSILGSLAAAEIGPAEVSVENEARLATDSLLLGDRAKLTIRGAESKVETTALTLGERDRTSASVTIDDRATLSASSLLVGDVGSGTVTITNRSTVVTDNSVLGCAADGIFHNPGFGTVVIDGNGASWTNTGHMTLGAGGNGEVDVINGARVTTSTATIGGRKLDGLFVAVGSGRLTVDGENSLFSVTGDRLNIGFDAFDSNFTDGFGQAFIRNGGHISADSLITVYRGSTLSLDDGTVTAKSLNIDGRLEGAGTITADVAMRGKLAIAFTDSIDVVGNLSLGDESSLVLASNHEQEQGTVTDLFPIMTFTGELAGEFSTPVNAGVDSHLGRGHFVAAVETEPGGIQVAILAALPGDADGDRCIRFRDFVRLADAFGGSGDWTDGDFNLDGRVDFDDFPSLADRFGTCYAQPVTAAVPEPGGRLLLALAPFCLTIRGSRRGVARL